MKFSVVGFPIFLTVLFNLLPLGLLGAVVWGVGRHFHVW